MSLPMEQQGQPPGGYGGQYRPRGGGGSIGQVIAVLAVIAVLGAVAVVIGRLCSGRRVWGLGQYDIEGWLESKCASCIDGRITRHVAPPAQARQNGSGAAALAAGEAAPEVKPATPES